MAITWRNIGQSSNSGNNLISGASDTIAGGLDALRNAAQSVSDEQSRQYREDGKDNTAKAFNQLASLKADDTDGRVALLKSFAGQNIDQQALAKANFSQSGSAAITQQLKLETERENIANQKAIDSYVPIDTKDMSVKEFSSMLQNSLRKDESLTEGQKNDIYLNQYKRFGDRLALANQEAQLKKLKNPTVKPSNTWTKLDANTLYNQVTGETKAVEGTASVAGNGNLTVNPDTGKPFLGAQDKAYGFYQRAIKSRDILDNIVAKGFNPADLSEKAAAGVPFAGNILASKEHQQYYQALDDVLKAVLRDESGAAIPESEIASYRETYSPRIGDSSEVVTQKRNSLDALINQFKVKSGNRNFSSDTSIPAPKQGVPEGANAELDEKTKAAYDKYGVSY